MYSALFNHFKTIIGFKIKNKIEYTDYDISKSISNKTFILILKIHDWFKKKSYYE